jgi:hypothetical protein
VELSINCSSCLIGRIFWQDIIRETITAIRFTSNKHQKRRFGVAEQLARWPPQNLSCRFNLCIFSDMTCYLRNGTASPKAAPCDHNAVLQNRHTGCCDPGDLCLTNGLCRNPNVNDLTNYAWFFGCTDKTFNDPACGNYCDTVNSK